MQQQSTPHSSWQELVGAPPPGSHVVQIYDSEAFLAAVASLFVAEGLARGEAVVLNGTESHVQSISAALRGRDVDADAAFARGQIVVLPIAAGLAESLVERPPDAALFEALTGGSLARASADERFRGVRWWGETSNVLFAGGHRKAALAAEELGGLAARKYAACFLCSFLCDRFDPRSYDGLLHDLCARHSHLIPAKDYVSHRLAVNRAVAEVVGEIRGPLLQSLLSWQPASCELPSSQAVLFWLRDTLPEAFAEVLARLRAYES